MGKYGKSIREHLNEIKKKKKNMEPYDKEQYIYLRKTFWYFKWCDLLHYIKKGLSISWIVVKKFLFPIIICALGGVLALIFYYSFFY